MVAEIEPNNTPAQAQALNLGFDGGEVTSLTVNGNFSGGTAPIAQRNRVSTENNNSIGLADETGIEAGETDSVRIEVDIFGDFVEDEDGFLVDVPDVDFFRVSSNAGQLLQISTEETASFGSFDTILELYDSNGNLIAFNDDISFPSNLNSAIEFLVPEDGDYFIAVSNFGSNTGEPFDPDDNSGSVDFGVTDLIITQTTPDIDYYEVELNAGDILGGAVDGAAQNIQIFNPDGDLIFGSDQNVSFIYGDESELVGNAGDNATAAVVAAETGTYLVAVTGGSGSYDLDLNVNRPALEAQAENNVQHFYLDFDGHTMNANVFGEPSGNITFDPLADFLDNWGLANTASNRDAVMDSIISVFERELVTEVAASGTNNDFDIVVINSRDHPDPEDLGIPNISRLIIGGTIADTGIPTIGLAENLDVGNFDTSDTAFVLLDLLSEVAGDPNSINSIALGSGVSIIDAIGLVVGTIAAHEAGHLLGNFHTENGNSEPNVQDQGGNPIPLAFAGEDGILGTSDDPDISFGEDAFEADEGLQGTHDTLNNISNAATTGQSNGFAYRLDTEILSYRGDNSDDQIGVSINSIEDIYFTAFSNQTPAFLLNNIFNDLEQIVINAGDGDNNITIFNSSDNAANEQDPLLINLDFTVDTVVNTGTGVDIITTSFGDDNISAGDGNDTLNGRGGADVLNGGTGVDTASYEDSTEGVTVFTSGRSGRGGDAQGDVLDSIENIIASDQNDNIILNADTGVDNTVNAGGGDDRIRERDGGTNVLNGEDGDDNIFGGTENDTLNGGNDEDNLFGGGGNDTLNGGDDAARDTLFGSSGDDILNGGGGNDALRGNTGMDTLNGGDGTDNLQGGNQNDILNGDAGVDTLDGGSGNDILNGGTGNDRLTGGGSNDIFIFEDGSGIDRITDFNFGSGDQIDLTDFNLADFDAVMALATEVNGDVRIQLDGDDRLILEDTTLASLDANDFILASG